MANTCRKHKCRTKTGQIIRCIELLAPEDSPARILEIGCGNGHTARRILKHLNVKLECIDTCKELLETAKRMNKCRRLKAIFKKGDALHLPYRPETFDMAFTGCHLTDIHGQEEQVIREIHRIVKPGGYCIVTKILFNRRKFMKSIKRRFIIYTTPRSGDKIPDSCAELHILKKL